jgi:hypothetical protein
MRGIPSLSDSDPVPQATPGNHSRQQTGRPRPPEQRSRGYRPTRLPTETLPTSLEPPGGEAGTHAFATSAGGPSPSRKGAVECRGKNRCSGPESALVIISVIEFLERMEDGNLGKGFDFLTKQRRPKGSGVHRGAHCGASDPCGVPRPSGFLAAPHATDASTHPRPVSSPMVGRRVRGVNGGMG